MHEIKINETFNGSCIERPQRHYGWPHDQAHPDRQVSTAVVFKIRPPGLKSVQAQGTGALI